MGVTNIVLYKAIVDVALFKEHGISFLIFVYWVLLLFEGFYEEEFYEGEF